MLPLKLVHQLGEADTVVGYGPVRASKAVMRRHQPANEVGQIGRQSGNARGLVTPADR